ncbi:MAG: TolC family protein [Burkholderiales bacterium]|nr:TolC family protein [Burkholderiales bacterium]
MTDSVILPSVIRQARFLIMTCMNFLKIFASILLFPMAAFADASPAKVLTLESAIASSLAHQPAVAAARALSRSAGKESDAAAHALFPQVSLNAGDVFSHTLSGTPDYFASENGTRETVGQVILDQALYDPGKAAALSAARAQADFARFAALQTRLAVAEAAAKAFYALRDKEAAVQIWQNALEQAKLSLTYTQSGYEGGIRTRLDLVRAQVQVSDTGSFLSIAQAELNTATQLMSLMTGLDPLPPLAVPRQLELLPIANEPNLQLTALESRPELSMARSEVARRRALLEEAEGAQKPKITLQAAYGWDTLTTPILANRGWAAGLNLSMPLFSWGMLRERESAARLNLQASEEQQKETTLQIDAELKAALGNVQVAKAAFEASGQLEKQYADIYSMSRKGYQAGRLTSLDLALARKDWVQSQIRQEQAHFNLRLALVKLDLIMGTLPTRSEETP